VHLVTAAGTALPGVTEYSRMTAVERLRGLGVQLWTTAGATFTRDTATITSALVDTTTTVPDVTDVVALDPPAARDDLAAPLAEAGLTVHVIGDAVAPRTLLEAMTEAHVVGRSL
jgi:hypothetical protein